MADNEILKDAELEEVVGGNGMETMGLLNRLQREGLYTPTTPLVAGQEQAAATELKKFLGRFRDEHGNKIFDTSRIFGDSRSNHYGYLTGGHYNTINADRLISKLHEIHG